MGSRRWADFLEGGQCYSDSEDAGLGDPVLSLIFFFFVLLSQVYYKILRAHFKKKEVSQWHLLRHHLLCAVCERAAFQRK